MTIINCILLKMELINRSKDNPNYFHAEDNRTREMINYLYRICTQIDQLINKISS